MLLLSISDIKKTVILRALVEIPSIVNHRKWTYQGVVQDNLQLGKEFKHRNF